MSSAPTSCATWPRHCRNAWSARFFCPAEGRIDPLRATAALSRLAQARGAKLLRGTEVLSLERDGSRWRATTSQKTILARRVVNAAGPWAAHIGKMVGLDLPVTGTVQQVIVTEPAPRMVEHLVAYANRHLSLKQQDSGGLLIGGGWFGSFDPTSGRSRNLRVNIQGNLWVAARVLPALRGLSIVRSWTGINTAIDRAPILGEAPGLPGFFNAVTANGYTLGPVTGRITADTILHGAAGRSGFCAIPLQLMLLSRLALALVILLFCGRAGVADDAWSEVLGHYAGPVWNDERIEDLATEFFRDGEGNLVGRYHVEGDPPFDGELTDFQQDGPNSGIFVWHDRFGEGVVKIVFDPAHGRFTGLWGDDQPVRGHVFNGMRIRPPATSLLLFRSFLA